MSRTGQFQPGQSGNPGGRPPSAELAALARRYTPDALKALIEVVRTAIDNPAARVAAAKELIDRGYGRAPQTLNVAGLEDAVHLHLLAVSAGDGGTVNVHLPGAPAIVASEADPVLDFDADRLLPPADPALPHEALPLWDAVRDAAPGRTAPDVRTAPDSAGDDDA